MRWRIVVAVAAALSALPVQASFASFADTVISTGNSFVAAALAAPSSPAATAAGGKIKVSWVATTSDWANGYELFRATAPSGPYAEIAQITPRTKTDAFDESANPGVTYYYRLHSYYGAWTSTDTAVVGATVVLRIRVGESTVQGAQDEAPAGTSKAFAYTASASGKAAHLTVYLDAGSTATTVVVALYSNAADSPGTLLGQATVGSPLNGAWNTAVISGTSIRRGTKYWIAVLAPAGSGTVRFRDSAAGAADSSQTSSQTTLSTFPSTWASGAASANSPMAAYASP